MTVRPIFLAIVVVVLLASVARGQDEAQDARIQQYVGLLQPAMWRELEFIRQVCELTPEQRPQVRAAGDAAVKDAAKAILQPQRAIRSQPTAAAQVIHDSLHGALKKSLTAEQLATYETEDAGRIAAMKKATIASVVSQLDGVVFLTKEQREKIIAALDSNWQREWEQWLMMHQYAGQYFPQVPDQYVTPHLNPEQTTVWNGLQKVSINAWHDNGRRPADDGWWKPQAAKTVAKTTAKNAKGKAALLQAPKKAN